MLTSVDTVDHDPPSWPVGRLVPGYAEGRVRWTEFRVLANSRGIGAGAATMK